MSAPVPPVFLRWENFTGWLLEHTAKFPKRVIFTFRTRIDNLGLDIFENLIEARYTRERQGILRRINLDLEKLRLLLRLAAEQRVLHACGELEQVGRMVGGWLRAERRT